MRRSFTLASLFILIVSTTSAQATALSRVGEIPSCTERSSDLSKELLATLIRVEGEVDQQEIDQYHQQLTEFLSRLRRKQQKYKSERRFLSYFFYKVHRQFLKHYRAHTTLYDLMEKGDYDCVTGSALYALLLDGLGFTYQIHEFPYHVYLTVTTADQDTLLIESTDPLAGFVSDATEQKKRFDHYSQHPQDANAGYQYSFTIQENIGLVELAGLSYFNEAVAYYNHQEFQQALRWLRQAEHLYDSPRMEAFMRLVTNLAHN